MWLVYSGWRWRRRWSGRASEQAASERLTDKPERASGRKRERDRPRQRQPASQPASKQAVRQASKQAASRAKGSEQQRQVCCYLLSASLATGSTRSSWSLCRRARMLASAGGTHAHTHGRADGPARCEPAGACGARAPLCQDAKRVGAAAPAAADR